MQVSKVFDKAARIWLLETFPSPVLLNPLLFSYLDAFPQTLDHELLAGRAAIDVPDIHRSRLEVAAGVIALGDEDVVLGAVLERLIQGNWRTLGTKRVLVSSV